MSWCLWGNAIDKNCHSQVYSNFCFVPFSSCEYDIFIFNQIASFDCAIYMAKMEIFQATFAAIFLLLFAIMCLCAWNSYGTQSSLALRNKTKIHRVMERKKPNCTREKNTLCNQWSQIEWNRSITPTGSLTTRMLLMENIFFLQIENSAIDEHARYIQCNEFRVYRKCYTVQ